MLAYTDEQKADIEDICFSLGREIRKAEAKTNELQAKNNRLTERLQEAEKEVDIVQHYWRMRATALNLAGYKNGYVPFTMLIAEMKEQF